MITSFRVGAIFEIKDQATGVVAKLALSMRELAKDTALVKTELQAISNVRITSIATRVAGLAANMDKAATAAAAMSQATVAGLASMDAGLTTALASARALTAQLAAAGRAGSTIGRVRPPPLPGMPPALPGGGGHGGRTHFGRIGFGVPMLGGHGHVSTAGTGAGLAAGAGLYGVAQMMKDAQEPLHQRAMLRLLGIDDATIGQMETRSRSIASAVPGSGYAKNLGMMGELYSIVGASGAMAIAPKLAEIDRVQSIVAGGKHSAEGSGYVLTRATELMGQLTDPKTHQVDVGRFGSILDNMSRISIATHGKVTPAEWLNYAKQAGPASGNLTEDGLYTTATIIQAMGGYRAGTAAQAIQRQFAGGVMTKSKADELKRLGIFKEGDYTVERGGHVQFKNDAAAGFVRQLGQDPLLAIGDTLIPALESHGISSPEAMSKEMYKILGTGPSQREVYEIIRGREQIKQERERAKGAQGPGAAIGTLGSEDPTAAASAFSVAFKDLLGAIGGPLMTAAIPGMQRLTSIFNQMSEAATGHKTAAGIVGTTLAGAATGGALGFGVGWAGGPIGAGMGALIGTGVGAGYGAYNALPSWAQSAITGVGGAALNPFGTIASGWGAVGAAVAPNVFGGAGSSPATNNNINATITVKAETDRPATLAEMIMAELNKLMTQGHTRNLGDADSAASSPYATGAGLP